MSLQIAGYIRSQIMSGKLQPGQRLPTTLEMVSMTGAGSHTIREAIGLLELEGLIESTPRRGTFVKALTGSRPAQIGQYTESGCAESKLFYQLAVMSDVNDNRDKPGKQDICYEPEIMGGILKECEIRMVVAQILPSELRETTGEKLYQIIHAYGCNGVIWPNPAASHWQKITYLIGRSVPIIVTCRSRLSHYGCSCIECDYEEAGFEIGDYFLQNGCDSILLLQHFLEPDLSKAKPVSSAFPYGIRQGISQAFTAKGIDSHLYLRVEEHPDNKNIEDNLITALEKISSKTAVIFTSIQQFLELLRNKNEKAVSLLSGKLIAILSNYSTSIHAASLLKGIDPIILIDPYEDVGKLAVQKILGMIEGYLVDTTTLAKIKIRKFSNLGFNP